MPSEEFWGFDRNDIERVNRAVKMFEDVNPLIQSPEEFRSVGRSVGVRIMGAASAANAGMYPAQFVEWKPGNLWATASGSGADTWDTGFSAGTGDMLEWCDKFFSDNAVQDAWLILDPAEFDNKTDDELVGMVLNATVVGENPKDRFTVVLRSFKCDTGSGTGSGSGGRPTLDVVTNVCPAPSGSGKIIEYRTITFPLGTVIGDPVCVVEGDNCCAEGPGSGSGSGSGSGPAGLGCCPGVGIPSTTFIAFAVGGTAELNYGVVAGYWYGSHVIGGCTVYFRVSEAGGCAGIEYSVNESTWFAATCINGESGCTIVCSPTFSVTGVYSFNWSLLGGSCSGSTTGTYSE